MKASELMVGDFVYVSLSQRDNKYPHKICPDDIVRIFLEINTIIFEPIPLTEKILKANGFDPIICCNLSMPKWFMSIRSGNRHVEMSFKYVHELQHALRLCGLNELADNFKIE